MVEKWKTYDFLQWNLIHFGEGLIALGILKRGLRNTNFKTEKINLRDY